jgi:hypothetical protein
MPIEMALEIAALPPALISQKVTVSAQRNTVEFPDG